MEKPKLFQARIHSCILSPPFFLIFTLFICYPSPAVAVELEFLSQLPIPGSVRDVIVEENEAFIANSRGLVVVDVSDPYNPVILDSAATPGTAVEVWIDGPYSYIADGDSGVAIFDISAPWQVSYVRNFTTLGSAVDIVVWDGFAYLADSDSGMSVYDVSNVVEPQFMGYTLSNMGPAISIDAGTIYSDRYTFVSVGVPVFVVDITDPTNPFETGLWGNQPGGFAYEVDFEHETERYFWAADGRYVPVVDLSDPEYPATIADSGHLGFAIGIFQAFLPGDKVYVAEGDTGVEKVYPDFAHYNTSGYAYDIHVVDSLVYVADSTALVILKETGSGSNVENQKDKESPHIPETFVLYQNYPNPFNPVTRIPYELAEKAEVLISIYNMRGKLVRRFREGVKSPGKYSVLWNGSNEMGERVSSGTYYYQLRVADYATNRRMVILK